MSVARLARVLSAAEPELDEACLAIAGAVGGPLDEIEWLAVLDVLAGECATPTPAGVVRYLVDDASFRGNVDDYYDWRNSCLDRVLDRRLGIPITLGVVAIEVARRVGARLVCVGLPGHVLLADPAESGVFFDPFQGSEPLDLDEVRRRFDRVTGGRAPFDDRYLAPMSTNAIVERILANLRAVFAQNRDAVRSAIVVELRHQTRTPSPDGPDASAALN
ncbi:MAG: transglutaminase-like domain-containing protein [Actinomycetota bacterium]